MSKKIEIVDDQFSFAIMEAILELGDTAFGIHILNNINEHNKDTPVDLECVYETLIDLLHNDRVRFRLSDETDWKSRKIYYLTIPEDMLLRDITSTSPPTNWTYNGTVMFISGEIVDFKNRPHTPWERISKGDYTRVIAYRPIEAEF